MDSSDKSYLEIATVRKTVTIDVDHQVHAESSSYVGTREWQRGAGADLTGVTLFFGPSKMIMSTQEAIDLATAITEAALFYREKKADALAHYEAMARDAKAGVA